MQNLWVTAMTKYISLLQLKGGVGKSTLAINLIGYFISRNKRVLGVDGDLGQGTLTAWSHLFNHKNYTSVGINTLDELMAVLQEADNQFDIVITDLPPRLADIARSSLVFSDLVLMPVYASAPDIWAAGDISPLIEAAKKEGDVNLRIVWNRFKPTKRKEDFKESSKEYLGHKEMTQTISDYVAYSDVVGMGTWVGAHNHPKAKAEFIKFAKEVEKLVK